MSDAAPPGEPPRSASAQFRRNPESFARMSALMSSSADAKFLHYMVSISGVARQDRVLEVACGPGACALAFAERCGRAVGLDPSAELIAEARASAAPLSPGKPGFMLGVD